MSFFIYLDPYMSDKTIGNPTEQENSGIRDFTLPELITIFFEEENPEKIAAAMELIRYKGGPLAMRILAECICRQRDGKDYSSYLNSNIAPVCWCKHFPEAVQYILEQLEEHNIDRVPSDIANLLILNTDESNTKYPERFISEISSQNGPYDID